MRNLIPLLLGVALCSFAPSAPAAQTPPKTRVLLISGDDVGAHNWRETTPATREVLEKSGLFDVRVSEDMFILESNTALEQYDVIYFLRYNTKRSLSDPAKENLLNFVKAGKGFVVTHLASASFPDWPEFRKLCGRYWVMGQSGHGPRGKFNVKIVDPEHPITKESQAFETDDELYAKLQGDAPINVLATADSDWSKKTEPMIFTLSYGKGRVFHHTFGHDGASLRNPPVAQVIVRGTQWAANK